MSAPAFTRLPKAYRDLCKLIADERPTRKMGGFKGSKTYEVPISPKNRNVRAEADYRSVNVELPDLSTRQQRRRAAWELTPRKHRRATNG